MSEIPVAPVISDAIISKMKVAVENKSNKRKKRKDNTDSSEQVAAEKATD